MWSLKHHKLTHRVVGVLPVRRFQCMSAVRAGDCQESVESRCGAVAVGMGCLLPPLSSGGARVPKPWLRFHTPLIEPDMRIARIRLSDRTSRLHSRQATPPRAVRRTSPKGPYRCESG